MKIFPPFTTFLVVEMNQLLNASKLGPIKSDWLPNSSSGCTEFVHWEGERTCVRVTMKVDVNLYRTEDPEGVTSRFSYHR